MQYTLYYILLFFKSQSFLNIFLSIVFPALLDKKKYSGFPLFVFTSISFIGIRSKKTKQIIEGMRLLRR